MSCHRDTTTPVARAGDCSRPPRRVVPRPVHRGRACSSRSHAPSTTRGRSTWRRSWPCCASSSLCSTRWSWPVGLTRCSLIPPRWRPALRVSRPIAIHPSGACAGDGVRLGAAGPSRPVGWL